MTPEEFTRAVERRVHDNDVDEVGIAVTCAETVYHEAVAAFEAENTALRARLDALRAALAPAVEALGQMEAVGVARENPNRFTSWTVRDAALITAAVNAIRATAALLGKEPRDAE
jgi:hypothetical protein